MSLRARKPYDLCRKDKIGYGYHIYNYNAMLRKHKHRIVTHITILYIKVITRKCNENSSYQKQELRILRKYYLGSPHLFVGVRVANLLSFLCSVFCVVVLCLDPMFSVSLDCLFVITSSVFSRQCVFVQQIVIRNKCKETLFDY